MRDRAPFRPRRRPHARRAASGLRTPTGAGWIPTASLVAGDLATTALAFGIAIAIRGDVLPTLLGVAPFAPVRAYASLWPVLLLVVAIRAGFHLYPGYGSGAASELRAQSRATLLSGSFLLIGGVLFGYGQDYSRIVLVLTVLEMLVLLPLVRAALKGLLCRFPCYGVPVAVFGRGARCEQVRRLLRRTPSLGLRVADPGLPAPTRVLVVPDGLDVPLADLLDELGRRYRRVWLVPDLLDVASVWVTARDLDGHLALELRNNLLEPWNRAVKRALDVAVVLLLAPLVAPVCLAVAALVRLDSPGPVLFRQRRIGRRGRPILIPKFRTMRSDAEEMLARLLAEDPGARAEWATFQKLRRDPRVTPVGAFLRRTSLDELPQLWSVLTGDMSLVGPRPVLRDELRRYGHASLHYLQLRPGLTGLVQVSGRSDLGYERRIRLDAYYVRNWSLWLDLVILARTVTTLATSRGAF